MAISLVPGSRVATFANVIAATDVASLKTLVGYALEDDEREKNRKFIEGDHWQDGEAWFGPAPAPGETTRDAVLVLIAKAFVFRNTLVEIRDRHANAVYGKEPRWQWVPRRALKKDEKPTDAEQALIDEVEAAQTEWWDDYQVHSRLKSGLQEMLWARRSVRRLIVPGAGGTIPNQGDLATALKLIQVDCPDPKDAVVWEDPVSKRKVGVLFYRDEQNLEHAEVTYLEPETGKTVIKILPEDAKVPVVKHDWHGALPVAQLEAAAPLISGALRSLQCVLNMTLTLLGKGFVDAAFLERLITNALPPGHWEYQKNEDGTYARDEAGNLIRTNYVLAKHITGGKITTYMQGIDYTDKDGKTTIKDPSVSWRPVSDQTPTIKGSEFWYASMLGEARQDHVLIQKEATPSGKSREQARGDFIDSTKDSELQAEMQTRTLLLAAVAMAEKFMGQPGKYTNTLKPIAKCRTSFGPLATDEKQFNINAAKDGFLSDATAMEQNGVDDVDAENARIQAQSRATLKLSLDQATAADAWVTAGFARETALYLIGLDKEEVEEVMKWEADAIANDPTPPPPAPGDITNGGQGNTPPAQPGPAAA